MNLNEKNAMKALNLHGVGDLRLDEMPLPACDEDEVLVKIGSCGVCGSDLPRVYTKGTYHFPTVIGHECAGTVVHDPRGELTGVRAAIFPLLPCFTCEACQREAYALCANYDYYGSRRDGGMAEYLAVKRWNLLPLPEGVSMDAGAMCEPAAVARHAVRKLGDVNSKHLLISGAGPIGLLVAMWARSEGVGRVSFFDLDEAKVQFAVEMGFSAYVDGEAVDLAIEGTGASGAMVRCLDALCAGGRMVLMGNPIGAMDLSQADYWKILRKELVLCGTWNSSYAEQENDWREALAAMSDGRIQPELLISHRVLLEKGIEALEMMKNRTETYRKVMLNMGENE